MEPKANMSVVKVDALVALMKKESPEMLGKVPEVKAVKIIRAALVQLGKQIAASKEGVVKVPALGNFRIQQVVRAKEGKKVAVKKVVFIAAKPIAGK